jgi:hypothetical protein
MLNDILSIWHLVVKDAQSPGKGLAGNCMLKRPVFTDHVKRGEYFRHFPIVFYGEPQQKCRADFGLFSHYFSDFLVHFLQVAENVRVGKKRHFERVE